MAQDPIEVFADVIHSLIDVVAGHRNPLSTEEVQAHHDALNAAVDSTVQPDAPADQAPAEQPASAMAHEENPGG